MTASVVRWYHRITKAPWVLLVCATLTSLADAAPPEVKLTTEQIRSTIGGHHVTDGRHWGHDYFLDGRLERSENGRVRAGHWSARNNQPCLLLPEVSKDSPVCFDVVRVGSELQYRDAGTLVYAGRIAKGISR